MRAPIVPLAPWLRRRGPALVLYAAAVILVPLGFTSSETMFDLEPVREEGSSSAADLAADPPPERLAQLSGIWWRYEAGILGDPLRFYYFHGDGTGLYRYGKVGLTNTHSFDYDIAGDRLVLDFRKTGEHHELAFVLRAGEGDARDWLELAHDPREPGDTRYFRESDEIVRPGTEAEKVELGPVPAGHMWIDLRRFATGGQGFVMVQLRPAGIDGRGVGWFHRGDFDEWTTEALTYRIVGGRIELDFSLAGTHEVSAFSVETEADGSRWLTLADDPRDYWRPHRYLDIGPSFGAALAPFELGPFELDSNAKAATLP